MIDELTTVYRLFNGEATEIKENQSIPLQRLIKAYKSNANQIDLASLFRQELRYISYSYNESQKAVAIPSTDRLPDRHGLAKFNIYLSGGTSTAMNCWASVWNPRDNWIDRPELLDRDAFCMKKRYEPEPYAGDPFISVFGYTNYKSEGQQEAVRSTMMAPPGSTLVVNLPTGSGKSLCHQITAKLPFIKYGADDIASGLTIVVVPTIALALDQERFLEPYFPTTAFYGV